MNVFASVRVSLPQEKEKHRHRHAYCKRQHPALLASSEQSALHNVSHKSTTLNPVQTRSAKSRSPGGVMTLKSTAVTTLT